VYKLKCRRGEGGVGDESKGRDWKLESPKGKKKKTKVISRKRSTKPMVRRLAVRKKGLEKN